MNLSRWNITELAAWSNKKDQLQRRAKDFLLPHTGIWPADFHLLVSCCRDILNALDENKRAYFLDCCLASWLLDPAAAPPGSEEWIKKHPLYQGRSLPLPFDEARQWKWCQSVLLVSGAEGGRMIHALYGVGKTRKEFYLPPWADSVMDAEARQAVYRAWELAAPEHPGGAFWPMLRYNEPGALLHGGSLALPAYLVFRSMGAGQPAFTIGATGRIDSRGRLLPVKGLLKKYKTARLNRLTAFLYPDDEGPKIQEAAPTEPVAVSSLEEAEAVWLHSVPGIANETALLLRSHNDGEFVRRLCRVPGCLLEWLEQKNHTVSHALRSKHLQKSDMQALLNQMDELVKTNPLPRDRIEPVLAALNTDTVDALSHKWPDIAYRICHHQLRWSSNQGDTAAASRWGGKAGEYAHKAVQTGRPVDDMFLEDALRIVGRLHNRFVFQSELPYEFTDKLHAIENQYAILCKLQPGAAMKLLGKYYGTVIQNLAFCGPHYLDQVITYYHKACKAFGGTQQERDEIQRLDNYLVYAMLDAGKFNDAEQHLCHCLKIDSLIEHPEWNRITDPYIHAAIARFIADTKRTVPGYSQWAVDFWKRAEGVHPWQLWLYNAGRFTIDRDPKLATSLFQRSLGICRVFDGPTVRAMGLLPLSALYIHSLENNHRVLADQVETIVSVISESDMDSRHFAPVLETDDWQDALRKVQLHIKQLFPFNYR